MGKRPTICLSMIVRDESAVIRRCLRSVKPYIDAWVVSDTGSTDGTQNIVRGELAGIRGELIERPWVDFATNRNEALEHARKLGCDYVLLIDADEEFIPDSGFTLEGLDGDTYSAWFNVAGTEARWFRKLLVKSDSDIRYKFVLDETLDDSDRDNRIIENCVVRSYTDGARSKDGLRAKFERDIEVLQRAVEREPDEPRYWFYLGQRLGGAERFEEGIAAYQRRLSIDHGFAEERYASLVQIGHFKQALGRPTEELVRAFEAAFQERPTRAEPLLAIATIYAEQKQYGLAELYCRAAARMPRPSDSLLVHDAVYAWAANDTLAGILCEQGKLQDAIDLLEKLVVLPQCPEEQRGRIRENIALIKKTQGDDAAEPVVQLGPDELVYEEQAANVRTHGIEGLRKLARKFIQTPALQALPSPARFVWIAFKALFGGASSIASFLLLSAGAYAAAGAVVVASSPLAYGLIRRRLQDLLVAALTLAAIAAAIRGSPVLLSAAVLALLSCKEASVFSLPAVATAWLLAGHGLIGLATGIGAGAATWLAALFAIFGKMTLPLLRKAAASHATPYTLTNQRGAPHRLLVDLFLASPGWTLVAVWGVTLEPKLALVTLVLLACHAGAPVRNVRLVLAADFLIRAIAFSALMAMQKTAAVPTFLALVATDIYLIRKLRHVYDPTTAALAGELGMTRLPTL